MTEHEKIRELLSLAAAGALDAGDDQRVAQHLRTCTACSCAHDGWREVARGLRQLPTPLAPAAMVERTRLAVRARLAAEAEGRWDRRMLAFLILFTWTLTLAGWPIYRIATQGVVGWLNLDFGRIWFALVSYTALTWVTGGVAAALLALRHRREGRIA
jgi:anti-sigma factor RsiW